MKEREAGSQLGGVSSRSGAPEPQWQSGYWWRCRHFRIPVIVWIAASVLGGAAIGSALEPDRKSDTEPPTTEVVVVEPVSAVHCDENYRSDSVDVVEIDAYGIACD